MFKYLRQHFLRTMSNNRGLLSAILAAAPALMNLAGGLFGKEESGGETVSGMPDWQNALLKQLASWASSGMQKFTPGEDYAGSLKVGETSQETTGLGILDKLLAKSPTGDLFSAAKQQYLDTLGGRYANPQESPFIKSMSALSNMNLGDQINAMRRNRGALGTYFHSANVGEEGRLREGTQNYLNSLIGQFIESERGRMFEAAPGAAQLDEYENLTAPLKQVTASQTLGSLRRTLETADMERQYQDYLRKRKEMALPLETAQGLAGMSITPDMTMPTMTSNTGFGDIAELLSTVLGNTGFTDLLKKGAGKIFG